MKKIRFVLLRGLAREAGHWLSFPQDLQRAFPGSVVLTPDLPGFGTRRQEEFPASIKEALEKVRSELGEMDSYQNALIAISLGGMVGSLWIFDYPDDFSRAVFINTSLRGINLVHHRLRAGSALKLLVSAALPPKERERNILQIVSNHQKAREQAQVPWQSIAEQRPVSGRSILQQLRAAALFVAPRGRPSIPTLLLSSKQDRLVNAICSAEIAQRWGCSNLVHPTAGHDLPLDDGAWVISRITEFMSSKTPS